MEHFIKFNIVNIIIYLNYNKRVQWMKYIRKHYIFIKTIWVIEILLNYVIVIQKLNMHIIDWDYVKITGNRFIIKYILLKNKYLF